MHKALVAFYALIDQKSALFKIFDLKVRRFRGIFALSFMQIGCRRSNKNKWKAPKYPALRQVRIALITLMLLSPKACQVHIFTLQPTGNILKGGGGMGFGFGQDHSAIGGDDHLIIMGNQAQKGQIKPRFVIFTTPWAWKLRADMPRGKKADKMKSMVPSLGVRKSGIRVFHIRYHCRMW